MILLIIQSLYFILPAYFANAAPVLVKKINFLNVPVDFGKKLNKSPVFGPHKTWRGIVSATILGGIIFILQKVLYSFGFFQSVSLVNYNDFSYLFGFLFGFGAIFGDLIKSYFKRRAGIKSGARWLPFDQIDFVIGALAFSSIVYVPSVWVWVILILITVPIHILARHVASLLNICSKW
ncbi:CDP-archaeol synthase [Candidatus Woesearchaeota archaeon]|nr:CDP-archaeol synthase [Candidatus Woesearchaeota archaeon]